MTCEYKIKVFLTDICDYDDIAIKCMQYLNLYTQCNVYTLPYIAVTKY